MATVEREHDHHFGMHEVRAGERRTRLVIVITAAMMLIEIGAGMAYGSMALLADGLHMASHTAALGIAAFAYVYARRHAADERFSFGTGKVNALAGFSGAILLAIFALMMAWESVGRCFAPIAIVFDQAILVAVVGLLVNALSVVILGGAGHSHEPGEAPSFAHGHGHSGAHTHAHGHEHEHEHGHEHGHGHEQAHGHEHANGHEHEDEHEPAQAQDHNLKSAYLHVLADALTSILAILALVAGKYMGALWLDPAMGILGALLVARWSIGLLGESSAVLLDRQAPRSLRSAVIAAVEARSDDRVTDLHIWTIAPGMHAAEIALVGSEPLSPAEYKASLAPFASLVHITVEVQHARSLG